MNYKIQNISDGVSISLIGNLLISEVDTARSEILGAINGVNNINIDLSDVVDCDTAGVQLIASLIKMPNVNMQISCVSDTVANSGLKIGYKIESKSSHLEENSDA